MDLLVLLASNPGVVFSRRTLLDEVWKEADVSEEVLTRAISTLRHVLSDESQRPKYIETIRKRGYRLVADVSPAEPLGRPVPAPTAIRRPRPFVLYAAALIVIAATVAGLQTTLFRSGAPGPAATESPPASLVVLPIKPIGANGRGHVADGLTEEILSRAGRLSGLRLTPYPPAFSDKTLREIGEELGINYALRGAVRWYDGDTKDRIRASIQLISVPGDSCLWSATFDRNCDDVICLQREIAQDVVNSLAAILPRQDDPLSLGQVSSDPVANNIYHQARLLYDRRSSRNDAAIVVGLLEKAVLLDSTFTSAYILLAKAYKYNAYHYGMTDAEQLDCWRRAALALKRLSPGTADGNLAMGYYYYYGTRDFDQAFVEFDSANEISPDNGDVLLALGLIHRRKGNWEESYANLRAATGAKPSCMKTKQAFVYTLLLMRRYDEAQSSIEETLRRIPGDPDFNRLMFQRCLLDPPAPQACKQLLDDIVDRFVTRKKVYDVWQGYFFLGEFAEVLEYYPYPSRQPHSISSSEYADYYLTLGQVYDFLADPESKDGRAIAYYDSARAVLEKSIAASEDDPWAHVRLGYAYAGLSQNDKAIQHAVRATELTPYSSDQLTSPFYTFHSAVIHALVGETDAALDEIEFLLSVPSAYSISFVRHYPLLQPIRNHPRIAVLASVQRQF